MTTELSLRQIPVENIDMNNPLVLSWMLEELQKLASLVPEEAARVEAALLPDDRVAALLESGDRLTVNKLINILPLKRLAVHPQRCEALLHDHVIQSPALFEVILRHAGDDTSETTARLWREAGNHEFKSQLRAGLLQGVGRLDESEAQDQIMKRLLRVGPKAGWLDVVVLTYSRASYLVLDSLGAAMVGVYAVADRVVGPALRVTGALSASSLPMFSELAAAGKSRELVGFYLRNLKRIGLGLGAIGLAVFMVIPPVLEHFFPRYVGSIPVLYVLYMGLGFMAVNQMTTSCLNGMGHFGWVAAVATINLGLYFIGAWLWVDTYQATGAAMATSFMEGCNMFMQIGLLMIALRLKNRELEREKR